MSETTLQQTARPQIRRFGVTLHTNTAFRHLLNIGPSPDGGIIALPRAKPSDGWVAVCRQPHPALGLMNITGISAAVGASPPKMHYHSSGEATVKGSGIEPTIVTLPRLDTLDGVPVLYFRQEAPQVFPVESARANDFFLVEHNKLMPAIELHAYVFKFATHPYVRDEFVNGGAWSGVRGREVYIALDLRFARVDSFLVFSPFSRPTKASDGTASTQLTAFHPTHCDTQAVTLHSADGDPVLPLPPAQPAPSFPADAAMRSTDRRSARRELGGGATYLGWV